MSRENVEIVRRALDAWNRRDIEALLALSDPDCEYVNSPTAVEPGTRHGHEELMNVMRAQWEILSDARHEIIRIYLRGREIIALTRLSRRMPGSRDRIGDQTLTSWTIRNGKILRTEVLGFGSAEVRDALRAAGLQE